MAVTRSVTAVAQALARWKGYEMREWLVCRYAIVKILGLSLALCACAVLALATPPGDGGARSLGGAIGLPLHHPPVAHAQSTCLFGAVDRGFSLVTYAGGTVQELERCARQRHISTLYVSDGANYVAYGVDSSPATNARFRQLFPRGVPAHTPLWALSPGPGSPAPEAAGGALALPQCLYGMHRAPLTLRVYEGGTLADLEGCARSLHFGEIYAFQAGRWLRFVADFSIDFWDRTRLNEAFHGVFAGGVPPGTPLFAVAGGSFRIWDCLAGAENHCSGQLHRKYGAGALDYRVVGGFSADTDWVISQRLFFGGVGGVDNHRDEWRLARTEDWRYDEGRWALLGLTGGGTWRDDTGLSPLFTVGTSRNVSDSRGIMLVVVLSHKVCVWNDPQPGARRECVGYKTRNERAEVVAWN